MPKILVSYTSTNSRQRRQIICLLMPLLRHLFAPRSSSSSTRIAIPSSRSFLKSATLFSRSYRIQQLLQAKEKSPQLDDGNSGFPPRDDDDGGGGGGGGNWSGGFFLFGFLAFLGFLKDKESEEDTVEEDEKDC